MSVAVHVPAALREHTEGASPVQLESPGGTVASVLAALFELHPGLRDRLLTEGGHLRPHVAIFVGTERIRYTGGLDTPIGNASELTIVPAVSGG